MLFFMIFLFWEFSAPFNQFGEPLQLVALELVLWAAIAAAEGFAIAAVIERKVVGAKKPLNPDSVSGILRPRPEAQMVGYGS